MNYIGAAGRAMHVLLVEDNLGDIRLTQEAFRGVNKSVHLHVARDGIEAMAFLMRKGTNVDAPRPDLILLDLKLPKMDGREVLTNIKDSNALKSIPIVILTTSDAEEDVAKSYQLQANCYLKKPVELEAFENLVKSIFDFWLTRGKPQHPAQANNVPQSHR
jgi:two-component system, chemotaxis family, response regulator Rcp1